MKTVLFYNDSEVFGGHEIMTARIMSSLASRAGLEVQGLCHAPAFRSHLPASVKLHAIPFHSKSPPIFMPGRLDTQIGHILRAIRDVRPDLLVVSQGYAESGVRGLLAGRISGVPTYSYIPFGNTNAELNNRFAAARDLGCRLIYRLPHGYITISNHQAELLRRLIRHNQTIQVIHNPADFDETPSHPHAALRNVARLEIAVVGRVVFKQKNQAVLIPLAQELAQRLDYRIHVVGDGPDLPRLRQMVAAAGLGERILLHGWMDRAHLVPFLDEQAHLILIPSFYEGLPLILLEALHLNKPFLISNLGLLNDYDVPANWRFDPKNPGDIAGRIADLRASFDATEFATLRKRVMAIHSSERFHADVGTVFTRLTGSDAVVPDGHILS
jgi:glycosyltransferase involved in cell wall biosynthesis